VPVHGMMEYGGSRSIAPHILNFGTRWCELSISHPGRFIPRISRLGGLQCRSGRFVSTVSRTPDHPAQSHYTD
jgi:hypothetical protein